MVKNSLFLIPLLAIMCFFHNIVMAKQLQNEIHSDITFFIEFVDTTPIQRTFWLFGKETLKIKANLVNNSQDTIYCEKMILNCNINFEITDSLGQDMQVNIPMVIDPRIDNNFFKKIAPKDKYSVIVDIFDMNKYDLSVNKKYDVSATYSAKYGEYFKGDSAKIFQGILKSNVIILEKS